MRAGILTVFICAAALFTTSAAQSEPALKGAIVCECGDPGGIELKYMFLNDEDLRYSEEYFWVAYTCHQQTDPEDGRTKLFIGTGLVYEDNPAYDLPFQNETEDQIFYHGAWYTYENFSQKIRASDECALPLS